MIEILHATTKEQILDNVLIRGIVFIKGQNIDWEIEFDGLDNECELFTAYVDSEPVGAARLYKNKVGRVATLKDYRKQGIGRKMMEFIETFAKEKGLSTLVLNAQLYVAGFYEHLGYKKVGDIFQEADIDHIKMVKEL